jgi:N,N'-diacetyllegionaminate synthase
MKKVNLNKKIIGQGEPVFFIAEIAGNFYTFEEGKRIINSAMSAGCNCVKFQTFDAETAMTKKIMFDMESVGKVQQYKVFKEYQCPKDLQKQIMDYCKKKGILAFSAPSHIKDIEFMEKIGNPVYKIGSDLACHIPALKIIAKLKKPIILSTGMCTLEEVRRSVDIILNEGNDQLILMHCVADYPTKPEEVNLNAVKTMKKEFGLPVGYSDHTIGPEISLAAVAMGADIIERHFKYSANKQGPDEMINSDEKEMKYIIETTRKIEKARGDGIKRPSKSEYKNRISNRVSICSLQDIPKGTVITKKMIDIKRPGYGIQPRFFEQIAGRTARKNIPVDEPITWDMI